MTDPDQPGEELDEAVGEGAEALGDPGVELVGDEDVGAVDDEAELVGRVASTDPDVGPLAPDDEFTGDETTRDIFTEQVPAPAEEAAVHIADEPAAADRSDLDQSDVDL
jgi:hypothetical protein